MIEIDLEKNVITLDQRGKRTSYRLDTPEAFAIASNVWLRTGWDNKYVYSFTWLGRPMIQLPEDMIRIQEVIYSIRPDVIIESGIAHGGSLVFYAMLCQTLAKGRVIGIDVEIRPHNRAAIEAHPLFPFITLIEGDSVNPDIVRRARDCIRPGESVMVLLDSRHTKEHVLAELRAYSLLVTPGSYLVAMDGIMEHVAGAPRTHPDWTRNNPRQAALQFVREDPRFIIEEPEFLFNEGNITQRVTYWPGAFIKRLPESDRGVE